MLGIRRLGFVVVVVALLAPSVGAHNCPVTCGANSNCSMNCSEADLRAAVALANNCVGTPGFSRILTFNTPNCVINMQQTQASAVPTGSTCSGDPERYAVCLTGHHITINGSSNTTFRYSGPGKCRSSCTGSGCTPPNQPALFTLQGHHNTVKNFKMEYFPEGIHLRSGDGHVASNVTSNYYCDEALTNDGAANALMSGITLKGFTAAVSPNQCYTDDGTATALCGMDKGIQLNAGTTTVQGSFTEVSQPVHVVAGTHTLTNAGVIGNVTNEERCQAVTAAGGRLNVNSTYVQRCKFGIRVVDAGSILATDNVLKDNYVSAFQVKGSGAGKLKGSGNRMRNNGFFTNSDCQRGALVVRDNPSAQVDFGNGNNSGAAVLDGTKSLGGNIFCTGGQVNPAFIYNAGSSCAGSTGGSIGAALNPAGTANCFENSNLFFDPAPITTNTSGWTFCTATQCQF